MSKPGSPNINIADATKNLSKDAAPELTGTNKGATSSSRQPKPWEKQKNTFFEPVEIDNSRWDKLYPYRLVVVDVHKGNAIVENKDAGKTKPDIKISQTPDKFQITFKPFDNTWEFILPITPQQLSIQTQFANQVSATLKGIVEEHNGVKFKIISASGTFGVWPYKPNKASPPGSPSILETLFSGTIQAANNLAGQFNRFINTISGKHPAALKPEKSTTGLSSTGYAYAMRLDQFLEQYAEAKKDPKNAGWRLVFDIPKQNQAFVVTPQQFVWQQSVEKPSEIRYSIQFKAWRRIKINSVSASPSPSLSAITPNLLQRIINGIDEARRTAASALNLITAVRGDFQTPLNILRQTALFVKDLAGIPVAVADLPRQIINDYKNGIKEAIGNLQSISFKNKKMADAVKKIQASLSLKEGLAASATTLSMLGGAAALSDLTDPSNEIFENPEEYYELFNSIPLSSLTLTPDQQDEIDAIIGDAQNLTVDDIIQATNQISELASQIANLYGAGDETYSVIYDKPAPFQRLTEMTIDEYDILNKLYEVIESLQILTATQELDDGRIQSATEYVAALAAESGITYENASSKFIVPVPFGLSIEEIAMRYLGNPDRWIEIATLNALKSPYIDETGFERYLLSNAEGRQFTVASRENLYVNQIITIYSNNQPRTMRRILNIETINETNHLITVDGLDNLDVYTTSAQARIKAYLPGTVNSSNQIFIPSDLEAPNDIRARPIPLFKADPLVGLSKVDLLLTDSGDIAFDNYKDIKLAGGMTNLIQALKLKFATPIRSLIKHPEYGSGVGPGTSTAEFTATDIYNKVRETIIADPRFSDIERLRVTLKGPTLTIEVSVRIANGNGILPLSFQI
jgi:hypothetical protein